jgi:hypothetical protein
MHHKVGDIFSQLPFQSQIFCSFLLWVVVVVLLLLSCFPPYRKFTPVHIYFDVLLLSPTVMFLWRLGMMDVLTPTITKPFLAFGS